MHPPQIRVADFGSLPRCPRQPPAAAAMDDPVWLTTDALCRRLAIGRSTLLEIRRQGLLKDGRHVVPKNPGCRRSRLLWHVQRCELALGRQP